MHMYTYICKNTSASKETGKKISTEDNIKLLKNKPRLPVYMPTP